MRLSASAVNSLKIVVKFPTFFLLAFRLCCLLFAYYIFVLDISYSLLERKIYNIGNLIKYK
ncbi:hypothetical protein OBV_24800 [Oscillibacter valericigenes Sjm18-20]|nr:hypothetical protein OBV_24800 [Oscillibacter valericigenes Sjm18-20]